MKRLIKNEIDRKKEIVDVARHLFLTREYDKTSMEEIVRTLGVAKGTVYHYFDSKEELLDAVVENLADEYVGVLTQIAKEMRGTALERLRGHPAVWIVDLCNECEFESESYWRALVSTARAADPLRLLTISFSGDPADVSARYARLRDVLDLATPHWPRVDGWEDALAPLSLSVERQSGLPVHAQEEARQGYEGDDFPVSAYVDACRAACGAGLLGYTQHTDAGFYADRGSLLDRLDPVTRAALTEQGRDRCGCAS